MCYHRRLPVARLAKLPVYPDPGSKIASPTVTSDEYSQNSDADEERAEEPYQPLCVLKFDKVYPYTIPNFEVITVPLRHAIVQGEDDDGFFREDTALLSVPTPKLIKVKYGCLVKVG